MGILPGLTILPYKVAANVPFRQVQFVSLTVQFTLLEFCFLHFFFACFFLVTFHCMNFFLYFPHYFSNGPFLSELTPSWMARHGRVPPPPNINKIRLNLGCGGGRQGKIRATDLVINSQCTLNLNGTWLKGKANVTTWFRRKWETLLHARWFQTKLMSISIHHYFLTKRSCVQSVMSIPSAAAQCSS